MPSLAARAPWLAIAIVLAGCERTPARDPVPGPKPIDAARVDAAPRDPQEDARAAALDRLYVKVTTAKRERSPLEAPVALTNAYVSLGFAYGYARLGRAERARALTAEARTALATVSSDPVHHWLLAAYQARIDQARDRKQPETPLPAALARELADLERMDRYKVDRLRESSPILERTQRVDGIGAFAFQRLDIRGSEFEYHGHGSPAERARRIGELVEAAATASNTSKQYSRDDRTRLLEGVLDLVLEQDEAAALPILARARAIAPSAGAAYRAGIHTRALIAASYFGRRDQLPELAASIAGALATASEQERSWIVLQATRVLRQHGLVRELDALLAQAARSVPTREPMPMRAAIAGGRLIVDPKAAQPALDEARKSLPGLSPAAYAPLLSALAQAYGHMPVDQAVGAIEELANEIANRTDSFGTSSHYALSVIAFVEPLIVAIAN